MRYFFVVLLFVACGTRENKTQQATEYNEQHRPQIHFSPKAHWMNDPNGLVFHNGVYHLFFQYYPDSTVWGPMHWGHATSKDLVHWTEEDIALYPDSLGYIFSGSAVVDKNNTSGLGKDGKIPLVAIFTYHDPKGAEAKRNDYQTQGLAYSLDDGKTWTKYEKNPVLKNPGIIDFRDPKVMWYEPGNKWIMTLATKDRITFYSSPDLKNWTKESEFGEKLGAHGGVWECPDLFPITAATGETVWALFVSINPGGPNGGSATQYFIGQFDGKQFTTTQTDTRWLDYGPDNYAGVTWSNVGDRRLFIGWMSNWNYGQQVPTSPWRSAMTVPRDIYVEKLGDKFFLRSEPAAELIDLDTAMTIAGKANVGLSPLEERIEGACRIVVNFNTVESFTVILSNEEGEKLMAGYNKQSNQYFIDRRTSGKTDFEKGFGAMHTAPRISDADSIQIELIIDNASIELFGDGGLSVMTSIYFPRKNYSKASLSHAPGFKVGWAFVRKLKSIWEE